MTQASIYSLLALGTLWGAQLFRRPLLVLLQWGFFLIAAAKFFWLTYLSAAQYFAWAQSSLSMHLLPPFASVRYFFFYAFTEFWLGSLIALAAGLFFWLLMRRGNVRFQERFLHTEELLLVLLCFLLVDHPFWIIYIVLILGAALITSAYRTFILHDPSRVSLLHFWLPGAIIVLACSPLLQKIPFISVLAF